MDCSSLRVWLHLDYPRIGYSHIIAEERVDRPTSVVWMGSKGKRGVCVRNKLCARVADTFAGLWTAFDPTYW